MQPVWIIGAGGHAKVVIDTLRTLGTFDVLGVLDDDPVRLGTVVLRVPIRGEASLESIDRFGIEQAIIAIGSNRALRRQWPGGWSPGVVGDRNSSNGPPGSRSPHRGRDGRFCWSHSPDKFGDWPSCDS